MQTGAPENCAPDTSMRATSTSEPGLVPALIEITPDCALPLIPTSAPVPAPASASIDTVESGPALIACATDRKNACHGRAKRIWGCPGAGSATGVWYGGG